MTNRYDIVSPRPNSKDGKTYWLKIGAMFPAKDGESFAIKLDALPLPDAKGEIWIRASVPLPPREEGQEPHERPAPAQQSRQRPTGIPERPQSRGGSFDEDSIPFAAEFR